MADFAEGEYADTLEVEDDKNSSARILDAIKEAERKFGPWQALCDEIDDVYAKNDVNSEIWTDPEYDLFWASTEVLKPAIYARPPQPVVSPLFKDRRALSNVTAEMLERTVSAGFDRACLDEAMLCVRDDLIFYNRGQLWVTYATDEKGGGQRFELEHVDRKDWVHPPARKWSDVPWVARRAWMTKRKMAKRFKPDEPDAFADIATPYRDRNDSTDAKTKQVGVWEVWHKADNRVYWVAEGYSEILDEGEPHLKLRGFFPCPRPAYGTLRPRSLEPRPDYLRYAPHFKKINGLTRRIYALLDMIRMKGLIAAGGDVGDAIEQAMNDDDNAALLIPVPAGALVSGGSAAGFVQWLPLADIATAITGLIEARRELFSDFDRLSGISDIMRGETEANETLGAQQLKSQYGSVRVREKIDELQRIARDVTQIVSEIAADKFSQETLLDMSQMEVRTKAEIEKSLKEAKADAKKELEALTAQASKMIEEARAAGQEVDPAQAKQQFEEQKQQIIGHFAPIVQQLSDEVSIDAVMKLLRDDKARGFAFEIATDSTVLTDEVQEKKSRNEFLTVFTGASQGLMALAAMGETGAKLAGEMLKFVLQPYRVGRELNGVIDDFIDAAPEMASAAQGEGGGDQKELIEANKRLAEAEMVKAQAATMKVEADASKNQAESQRKMGEMQAKMQKDQAEFQLKMADAQTKAGDANKKADLIAAQVDKLRAETAKLLAEIDLNPRKQDLAEYEAAVDTELRVSEHELSAQNAERDAARADRQQMVGEVQSADEADRAARQQEFSERQGERSDMRAERQLTFAEKQAQREAADA